MPEPNRAIAPDTPVLAVDGPLGLVESAVVSPRTGELARLVVELAFVRPPRFVLVPPDWLARVEPERVWLNRPRAAAVDLTLHRRATDGWLRPVPHEMPIALPEALPDDATLAERVRAALGADPLTADADLTVSVTDGIATLTGRTRTAAAAFQARKLALGVDGVWHAASRIVSDEAILVEIRRRVLLDPDLAAARVNIDVDLGRVRLAGALPSAEAAERARRLAAETPDVIGVETAFTLRP